MPNVMDRETAEEKFNRAKELGCEPMMLLPRGKTCADCIRFVRCKPFLGRKGPEIACDWSPSAFAEDFKGKYLSVMKVLAEIADCTGHHSGDFNPQTKACDKSDDCPICMARMAL